jgi:uncharacterized protein YfiM (DUF2279 family)
LLIKLPVTCFWFLERNVLYFCNICTQAFGMKTGLNLILLLCLSGKSFSQDSLRFFTSSHEFKRSRFISVVGLDAAGYGGSLALLSNAWYKDYDQTPFHSFDDSQEWLQMDKVGHFTTTYYLGRIGIDMMEWSGVDKKKAVWYGAAGSFLYMTGIEVLDGFSGGWGFSWSDMTANTLGTVFIIGQNAIENSGSRSFLLKGISGMSLKFSFHQTNFPRYRPSLLGTTLAENIIKDYNGQSYWLSCNLSSFMKPDCKFPKWLNLAFGYGADGMISGKPGYQYIYPNGNTIEFERYRQYYLSLDIDLTKIKTRSHFLKTVFETFSFIKIPAPALEFNKTGLKFHPFYY